MTGIVELVIRKRNATEAEADALRTKIALLTLSSDWEVRIRYIEHREVEK